MLWGVGKIPAISDGISNPSADNGQLKSEVKSWHLSYLIFIIYGVCRIMSNYKINEWAARPHLPGTFQYNYAGWYTMRIEWCCRYIFQWITVCLFRTHLQTDKLIHEWGNFNIMASLINRERIPHSTGSIVSSTTAAATASFASPPAHALALFHSLLLCY